MSFATPSIPIELELSGRNLFNMHCICFSHVSRLICDKNPRILRREIDRVSALGAKCSVGACVAFYS